MIDRREIELAAADFAVALREGALKIPLLERLLLPRTRLRTFQAGGLTITTEEEESFHAERWIKTGAEAEMTADRLESLMRHKRNRR